jgi:hypothetical protein
VVEADAAALVQKCLEILVVVMDFVLHRLRYPLYERVRYRCAEQVSENGAGGRVRSFLMTSLPLA